MAEELHDYKERHRFWTQISLEQLSTTNNLLLTISTGFLAFCFDKESIKNIIKDSTLSYNWSLFYYFASLGLIALSITLGIAVLFCRLYDFRISRHLSLTRKRFYEKHSKVITIEKNKESINMCHRLKSLYFIIFCEFPHINKDCINDNPQDQNLIDGVGKLKQLSKILGSATWRWTKIQVLLFFSSVICYVLHFWLT
ncbi:hypothetical protein ACM55F_04325 [Flavobacterium sp. XS2P12]|uniref:hypothetical protein n=1 Tax=Flavobacterium melibiosi TaxID=3398734 RepID=UPI003A878DE4